MRTANIGNNPSDNTIVVRSIKMLSRLFAFITN